MATGRENRGSRATIAFFPEGAYGPTNNCVGIADVLRERGHECVFIVEESFAGTLEAQGFEERLMRLSPPAEAEEVPGQFWKEFIRDTAPVFRKPTLPQLEEFIAPTFAALCDGARYVDDRLREIIDELDPAVIVEDNVVAFPALPASGRPVGAGRLLQPERDARPRRAARVLRLLEPGPLGLGGVLGGVRPRARGGARVVQRVLRGAGRAAAAAAGLHPRVAVAEHVLLSREADFRRARPLDGTWLNLEASVRATDAPWDVPDSFNGAATGRWSTSPSARWARPTSS